jgi:hypothetical protein
MRVFYLFQPYHESKEREEKTMMSKRTVVLIAFATVAGALLALGPHMQGDWAYGGGQAIKLEGAWIITVPDTPISLLETVIPIGPSGRRAVIKMDPVVTDVKIHLTPGECDDPGGFCLCPNAYRMTPTIGEAVMTGSRTAEATGIAYAMRPPTEEECDVGNCRDQVECIWVTQGLVEFLDPNTQEGTLNLAIFGADADQDGDLLPDEGAEPLLCMEMPGVIKRLPMLPPCTP